MLIISGTAGGEPSAPIRNHVVAQAPPAGRKAAPKPRTAKPGPAAATVYRPSDTRPRHDDGKLKQQGIACYTSKRLLLYTDIDARLARPLPLMMDQVYDAWEACFGPLPPDREGSDFQMTGYIMADRDRFVQTGLLPEALPGFAHGRHRGAEFWMNDQTDDYYRAHLMLHEGTHCFMTIVPNPMRPFVFYMEGMAELFGTHTTDAAGRIQFGVMPHHRDDCPGLGRIRMIEEDVQKIGPTGLNTIVRFQPEAFDTNSSYAWSWALCEFLNQHPRYRDRFRKVGERISASTPFEDFDKLFAPDARDLHEEWALFAVNICHGYDIERSAIEFKPGREFTRSTSSIRATIAADRGWQSSGVQVEAGRSYQTAAQGRFSLAQEPKPWESEPQGISFRYCEGRPLGILLGAVRSAAPLEKSPWTTMTETIPLGRAARFTAPRSGTLYLRVNEYWNELADNRGTLDVRIEPAAATP